MMLYAKEHDGKLPDCSKWCDELSDMYGLSRSLFICREAGAIRPGSRPAEPLVTDYGFNENLSGIKVSQVREAGKTVLLFEAERGQNVHGGPHRMISAPRHPDGFNFVFVDGHAKWQSFGRGPWGDPGTGSCPGIGGGGWENHSLGHCEFAGYDWPQE